MSFERGRHSGIDYRPCRYEGSRLDFRGPPKALDGNYIAFLGGTETYGRFVERPFCALLEQALGNDCVNLGCMNSGMDAFLRDPGVIDICRGAQATVLQITGAQNMTNRLYSVHPRRNDRFIKASELLHRLYREIDFTEVHFTGHMLRLLQQKDDGRFEIVRAEVKTVWKARVRELIRTINAPVVLLWAARRAPLAAGHPAEGMAEPRFVDRDMVEEMRPLVADVIICPESATARAWGTMGMIFDPLDRTAAEVLPGPAAHADIAARLESPLMRLLPGRGIERDTACAQGGESEEEPP